MTDPASKAAGRAVVTELTSRSGLFLVMGLYWAACFGLAWIYGGSVKPWLYAPVFAAIFVLISLFFVARSAVRVSRLRNSGNGQVTLATDLKSTLDGEDVVRVVLLLIGFSISVSLFQSVKAMVPTIQPFVHDALFAEMDKVIHAGFYPHELLQPLLGYPVVSFIMLVLYNLWLPLVFLVFVAQILDRENPVLQRRYLMSFLLAWILIGTVGAILLSSAGPVYYDQVTGLAEGAGPYADLMAYYRSAGETLPFFLTDMHDMLWQFYQDGTVGPGAGISAMPSVHVALATHMFLVMRQWGRLQARIFGTYAIVIFLGSVHLGWHYAIDGYLGAALMVLIWWFAGAFSKAGARRDTAGALD